MTCLKRKPATSLPGIVLWMVLGCHQVVFAASPLPVVINEFMARNTLTIYDEDLQYADWIELYNYTASPVNIGGCYMTDVTSQPMKWRIPDGTIIDGGGHLLIWADGTNPSNPLRPLHASFKMNADEGEAIGLYYTDGATTMDVIRYGQQARDISYGRYSDNWPQWGPFAAATPRQVNDGHYVPRPARLAGIVFINEWLTSNTTGIHDPSGAREDWIELYNAGEIPIDLGGGYVSGGPLAPSCYLTDDLTNTDQFPIPPGNVIGPKSWAFFWADKDKKQGPIHTNFKLSDQGGDIGLFESDLVRIDSLAYGRQTANVSQGRTPDGGPNIVFFTTPTPYATNVPAPSGIRRWILYR